MKRHGNYEIAVIIPTFNRSDLLSYTLESLAAQSIEKERFEVIVSDDGSTDNTREVVSKYENRLNLKYVFQEDKGYRPGSARNGGILAAGADIILLLDSGVLIDENCVKSHIDFHNKSRDDSAAIGYVYGFEENNNNEEMLMQIIDVANPGNSIKAISQNPAFYDVREDHYAKYNDRLEDLPAPWVYFWTAHVSARRHNLLQVGMFDAKFDGKWGVEDNDVGFKLHAAGVKICLLREAKTVHYPHAKDKVQRHNEGYENCTYFYNKYQTAEIKVFLDHFLTNELTDVNEILYNQMEGAMVA